MITFLAYLTKEAVETLKDKQKDFLEKIFKKIEGIIKEDEVIKKLLLVSNIKDMEQLSFYIAAKNPELKKEIENYLKKIDLKEKDIKIAILNSSAELDREIDRLGEDTANQIIYFSITAFKNGEKISGKILKTLLFNDEREKNSPSKFYEVDVKNKKVKEKTKKEVLLAKKEQERYDEELEKKKKKYPEIGIPGKDIGVQGPGL